MKRLSWLVLVWGLAQTAAAADFNLTDLQGKSHRLADYRGKWLLVNFWATWCPPCLHEVPDLSALHTAHKDRDLEVIGVALDSTRASVQEFVGKHHVSYPVVIGNYKLARQIGEVEVLPTSYLYDPSGKLVSQQAGILSREDVEDYLRRAR